MENFKLAGHAVRIGWNHEPGRSFHNEHIVFRGVVSHQEEAGLWLYGSFFVEKAETISVREIPLAGEGEDRFFFAPWPSMDVLQIIPEDSKDFEVHRLILTRRDSRTKKPEPFLR